MQVTQEQLVNLAWKFRGLGMDENELAMTAGFIEAASNPKYLLKLQSPLEQQIFYGGLMDRLEEILVLYPYMQVVFWSQVRSLTNHLRTRHKLAHAS